MAEIDLVLKCHACGVPLPGLVREVESVEESRVPARPVTEEHIRAVLQQETPLTTHDLVEKFQSRLRCNEDKDAFAALLRRISKIQKTNGVNIVVLRDK